MYDNKITKSSKTILGKQSIIGCAQGHWFSKTVTRDELKSKLFSEANNVTL